MNQKSDLAITSEVCETVEVSAFGQRIALEVYQDQPETERRLRDLKDCHERFLASRVLPQSGLCVDIGAGEGWFAVPFAQAFPNWSILCFEPDQNAFARLEANVKRHGLKNVTCIHAAFHPSLPPTRAETRITGNTNLPKSLYKALAAPVAAKFVSVLALSPRVSPVANNDAETVSRPALPLDLLAKLSPDLLKLDAPGSEEAIAQALRDVSVGFMMGPIYTHVPSHLFHPRGHAGPREFYLPYRKYALRRDYEDNFPARRPGLDVIVAMYNTADYILECVDSILADGNEDIRVIVVDDGSTDGCGGLVEKRYKDNRRVQLLRKANGGCASARNHGRQNSDASHIAFVDADDRVDAGMFTALLETARYTGAFVAEAEFSFLTLDEAGKEVLTPSYEAESYPLAGNTCVGPYDFSWIAGQAIAVGQPSIWRRVHRRDFLDRKNIWFPEHVRAFDDQIFQILISHYCGTLAHLKGYAYHYRQHPAQDIKQGDERHFYSFNMFRSIFLRALDENWADITMVTRSLLNTLSWSYGGLHDDLKLIYQDAAAEFLAIVSKTFDHSFSPLDLKNTGIDGLEFLLGRHLQTVEAAPENYGYMRLESWRWQPEFIRMMRAVKQ